MTDRPWLVPDPWEREAEEAEREHERVYRAAYRNRNRDRINAYHREYMEQQRQLPWQNAVGSLHSLSCTGPHTRNRPSCHPIPCYSRPRRTVA